MALIDCIKYDGLPTGQDGEQAPWLAYRLHCENLVPGTQLIVNRNQEAVLFHRGNVLGVFGPGAHTLSVANLPLFQTLVKPPLGVRTSISAEVYFVNKVAKLDVKWGTIEPLQITDPRYQIMVRVRAYGQFKFSILDSRNFVSQIAAPLHSNQLLDYQTASDYLRRLVVTKVKDSIADMMINKNTSIVDIMASVDSVSIACREKVATEFDRFGVAALSFLIESINVPEEDMAEVRELQRELAQSLAVEYKESLKKGDLTRSKLLCVKLVLLAAQHGDYTELSKYLPILKGYAKEEDKAAIENLIQGIRYRQERGIEPGEELLRDIEILTNQVEMK
ncbi:SPFH domain-containing protein [Dehalococcoidia bacterium]|nr:SPFH domain-containing protein [Dehalococcoidia bacterium]